MHCCYFGGVNHWLKASSTPVSSTNNISKIYHIISTLSHKSHKCFNVANSGQASKTCSCVLASVTCHAVYTMHCGQDDEPSEALLSLLSFIPWNTSPLMACVSWKSNCATTSVLPVISKDKSHYVWLLLVAPILKSHWQIRGNLVWDIKKFSTRRVFQNDVKDCLLEIYWQKKGNI